MVKKRKFLFCPNPNLWTVSPLSFKDLLQIAPLRHVEEHNWIYEATQATLFPRDCFFSPWQHGHCEGQWWSILHVPKTKHILNRKSSTWNLGGAASPRVLHFSVLKDLEQSAKILLVYKWCLQGACKRFCFPGQFTPECCNFAWN